jgi:hypothetical protein
LTAPLGRAHNRRLRMFTMALGPIVIQERLATAGGGSFIEVVA